MGLLGVAEAAGRLGVTTRQVQHLAAHGELRCVARGVIDDVSVDRYLAARGESRRRAWSERTAWGAVALLSRREAWWMGESQRSRLKARIRMLGAAELVGRARGRATVTRYVGHMSTATRLRAELVDTSGASEALGLTATTAVDGYTAAGDVGVLVARHGLIRDDDGRFTVRATTMDLAIVAELAQSSLVLASLDLAESLDLRERRAGLHALEGALKRFRV